MSMTFDSWLAREAQRRRDAGLERTLVPRGPDDATIDLAGNDYLGLTHHPRVVAAAADALERWGAGAGASRLVTGTLGIHEELEDRSRPGSAHRPRWSTPPATTPTWRPSPP